MTTTPVADDPTVDWEYDEFGVRISPPSTFNQKTPNKVDSAEMQTPDSRERTPMADILTDDEIRALVELGKRIAADLACNCNGDGFPCRTCRNEAERNMARYLRLTAR